MSTESTEGASGSAAPNIDGIQHLLPVKPPKSFDFAKHEEWPRWIKRFDRYRIVSGLHKRNEELQVNAFLYAMGGEAEDIMSSFTFAEGTDAMKYDVVKAKFDKHFVAKKNVIYERAKFNQRVQGPDEPVENFITALHCLVEFCEYGQLKEEMIRDRLVVGLRDMKLSEKLQMNAALTLENAAQQARQSESVKQQQEVIRHLQDQHNIDNVQEEEPVHNSRTKRPLLKSKKSPSTQGDSNKFRSTPRNFPCTRCGSNSRHNRQTCPAKDSKCHNCGKQGHFAKACRSRNINEVEEVDSSSSDSENISWRSNIEEPHC